VVWSNMRIQVRLPSSSPLVPRPALMIVYAVGALDSGVELLREIGRHTAVAGRAEDQPPPSGRTSRRQGGQASSVWGSVGGGAAHRTSCAVVHDQQCGASFRAVDHDRDLARLAVPQDENTSARIERLATPASMGGHLHEIASRHAV
jgi:hypothetical protein